MSSSSTHVRCSICAFVTSN
ncbi:hypothetical protein GQA12_00480 [Paenibacillus alvei]|nr:hypothetical protein [Paenibacillus alvei]